MIIKRIAEGVRNLDWLTVSVELVIVIAGVYVGIYIGDAASKRALQADVNRALEVLHVQLQEDLASLDEIIENQTLGQRARQAGIDALSLSPADQEAFAIANEEVFNLSRTFFPNRSAYQTMRDLGYLAEIEDPALQLLVAHLFERIFVRQDVNARTLDRMVVEYQTFIRDVYWDTTGRAFIDYDPRGILRLRNGLNNVKGQSRYYLDMLSLAVRQELVSTIDAMDTYLLRQ